MAWNVISGMFGRKNAKYSKIAGDNSINPSDDDLEAISKEHEEQDSEPTAIWATEGCSLVRFFQIMTASLALLVLVLWALISLFSHYSHPSDPYGFVPNSTTIRRPLEGTTNILHCGTTVAEARELGCVWDVLVTAWVPEPCFDEELTEEFRRERDWKYYEDSNATMEIPESSLSTRKEGIEGTFWTSLLWHKIHCYYTWRKMHRALNAGHGLDSDVAPYVHTVHCGEVLNDPRPLSVMGTAAYVEFLKCYL